MEADRIAPVEFDLHDLSAFSSFSQNVFSSVARADQRRWGEAYVRGLLSVPGRKSIRRISDLAVGRDAGQSLQQFVNQSPWAWGPVRRALAEQVGPVLRPRAWVVQEVVFPKNGDSSAAVARQYAPSVGRVLNCQRAIAVFLVGDGGSVAVDWRLVVPRGWDEDADQRAKVRLPASERSRPDWTYPLELVDELVAWGLPPAPVVVELHDDREVYPLVRGLEQRGLPYVVRVPASTPALPVGAQGRLLPGTAVPTVGRLVAAAAARGRTTLSRWQGPRGDLVTSQFVVATVPGVRGPGEARAGRPLARSRRVLAEWPSNRSVRPGSVWLTSSGASGIVELAGLLHARESVKEDVDVLAEGSGLRHFEGRSFQGWHHHVTLSSVAHGYRLVRELERQRSDERWLRPYA